MSATLECELETLLAESPQAAEARAASAFDDAASPLGSSLVLFGAGGLGRKTLGGLRQMGIEPIAFTDNNPALWNRQIEGVPVLSPEQATHRFGAEAVFVVTIWRAGGEHRFARTQQQLQQLGCSRVLPAALLFWKYPRVFLDYYCLGLPQNTLVESASIRRAFDWFRDEASRSEFVAQIRWRLSLDFASLPGAVSQEHYFPEDLFRLHGEEIFVDCGAFDGDSLAAFIHRQGEAFREVVALEPDPANFKKMQARVSRYSEGIQDRIRLEPRGAADFTGKLRFDADGSLSSAANPTGSLQIDCVRLDELLAGTAPTYIKMDIEGAEPEALRGAASVISQSAPILAISVYHKPNHLWRLPELMRSMNPDSHLFLRPHNEECWDTVCYAVPPGRLNAQ